MRAALVQRPAARQLTSRLCYLQPRQIIPASLHGVLTAAPSPAGPELSGTRHLATAASDAAVPYKRTHGCGDLRREHAGQEVSLCGWVHNLRQLGQSISFLVLRDAYGIVQARASVAEAGGATASNQNLFEAVKSLRLETIVEVRGRVVARPPELVNSDMATGEVEVEIETLKVLGGPAENVALPIVVGAMPGGSSSSGGGKGKGKGAPTSSPSSSSAGGEAEAMRLTSRHLDLRRWVNQRNLRLRSEVAHAVRGWLHSHRFVEVETPTLFRSTPEGAREFLVPTRHPQKAYALTQSPQQYKQLLMVGGVDRYYQIARCYRDESGRADRQPEFTQIDLEASFPSREGIMAVAEGVARAAWTAARGLALPASCVHSYVSGYPASSTPSMVLWAADAVPPPVPGPDTDPLAAAPVLPVVTYAHALSVYGSDKPDRRPGMPIADVTGVWRAVAGADAATHRDANIRAAVGHSSSPTATAATPVTTAPDNTDLSHLAADVPSIRAFVLPGGGGAFSRKEMDALVAEVTARAAGAGSSGGAAASGSEALTVAVIRVAAAPPEGGEGAAAGQAQLSDWKGHPICKDYSAAVRHALAVGMGAQAGDLLVIAAGVGGERVCKALGAARLLVAEAARLKGLPLTPAQHLYPAGAPPIPTLRSDDTVLFGGRAALGALSAALAPASQPATSATPETEVRPDLFWVTDFPLFEVAEAAGAVEGTGAVLPALASTHHPFTAPVPQDEAPLRAAIATLTDAEADGASKAAAMARVLQVRGQHYDLVCNGVEVGGGSLRIHTSDLQQGVLRDLLRVSAAQLEGFGPLLTALSHGAPPHGGIALGLDRLVMILAGPASAATVRDVIAFPKSANGNELLTGAPGPASDAQLAEYHIKWLA